MPSKVFVNIMPILCSIAFILNLVEMAEAIDTERFGLAAIWTVGTVGWFMAMSGSIKLWFLYKDYDL